MRDLPTRDEVRGWIEVDNPWPITETESIVKAYAYGFLMTAVDPDVRVRTLERQNRKLQERLNRISNAMIGNQRIWVLDRLAMECEVEADRMQKRIEALTIMAPEYAKLAHYIDGLRVDALYLRRLEWDLGELHVAVKGDTNRRGGRYDQAEFKGPRP